MNRFAVIIGVMLAVSACAPKITTGVLMPAGGEGISDIRNIAVLPFNGSYGKRITPSVENVLVTAEVSGKRYFTVADRQNLDKVMQEQKLQVSGVTDDSAVVKLGRLVGVEGIFTGTADSYTDSLGYMETRTRCSSLDNKGKCLATIDYTVACIKRRAEIVFIPRLIDVSTGRVVYSDRLTASAEDGRCSDSSIAVLSAESLLKSAENDVLGRFRMQVAPYVVNISLKLMDSKDGITEGDGRDKLKSSIKFAQDGRMDRACDMWQEGLAKYPGSVSFVFNLGMCSEIKGNYEKASELYTKADMLTGKPDKIIGAALERMKNRITERELLKKQMR